MRHSSSRRTASAVLVSLLVALEACGGGSASPASGTPRPAGSDAAVATPDSTAPASTAPELPLPADIPTATLAAEAGEVIATGLITPEDGGSISGTDDDGTTYSLFVEPYSVTSDVTVGIRPLHGSTELGPIVAGADLTPAGLRLLQPAELAIESEAIPAGWAAFDYRGDPSTAHGRLVSNGYPEAEYVVLLVPHFSGSVAVDLGSNAGALYEKWASTRGDDTPTGRQAAAEVRFGAATMAEQSGKISPETATGIRERATIEWIAAEGDRLANDPAIQAVAEGDRPQDLDTLSAEVGRILEFEARRRASGDESSVGAMEAIIDVMVRYETAITTKVLDSKEIKEAAKSGRVSDIEMFTELFRTVIGLDRQIQLLGGPETPAFAKIFDLLATLRAGLLKSCRDAPLDPALILGLERQVQLLGGAPEMSLNDIVKCAGPLVATPRPGVRKVTGQLTLDYTSSLGDRAHAVFDLVIVGDNYGSLVFAPGSTGKVDWTLAKPWEGCPATGSATSRIGTMDNEVVNPMSEPDPEAFGRPVPRGADLEIAGLSLPLFQRGSGLRSVACMFPTLSATCGPGLIGKLLHANPSEWSFSCSSESGGSFWSVGGRMIGS